MSALAAPEAAATRDPKHPDFLSATARQLAEMNRSHGWSLNVRELQAIQSYFKSANREPTRAELETFAQTWSEHCKHKTLTGPIRYTEGGKTRRFSNLLRETIMEATLRLKKPWCLSVFQDNAGIVRFDADWALAFKVETHNHPCALEPYGGSATGVGGVVRDVLGAGLGARPILNTDVFCLASPQHAQELPDGVLHPKRTLAEVVSGVRDYGNRMGIPTASGAIWFDDGFLRNPLVFCGTVGILPIQAVRKEVKPGDLIVAAGGRTGRDGIHGATFSSTGLEPSSPTGAVQIADPIVEKRLLDALLTARDQKLYRSITDCGAGGFSSAIGELGEACGARVRLEAACLKASDILPWEIWLSESQERMVLAVPPKHLSALEKIFAVEGVEHRVLGEFTQTGRLQVFFGKEALVDIEMEMLHHGLPKDEKAATWTAPKPSNGRKPRVADDSGKMIREAFHALLSHLNVCSRAWVIRQYDHEVQGGAVIKPLQGAQHDGPGDACVLWPHAATGKMQSFRGLAVAQGINPSYGRLDPYAMALACADEALRNLACVGADISQAAFLDNFCWGNPDDPEVLGGLVRAAIGCRDAALGFEVPFISGKDSLYNEYGHGQSRAVSIPGTLLISAIAPVTDIRKAMTMDFKSPGNAIYLVGKTSREFGGTLYAEWAGIQDGCPPLVDIPLSRRTLLALNHATFQGLIASCHDLSDGGLGVALAEMAFSGEIGAAVDLDEVSRARDMEEESAILFSESPSRFLVEVLPEKEKAFLRAVKNVPIARIGATIANPILRLSGMSGSVFFEEPLSRLKDSWTRPLAAAMDGK
ncbi:MAG: phosphoribosylformylglycinamidine synthase subunit PurL [Elusimicrobia bacterium]|nr:phosphoribosylformylglycinamidine synthase subunit PurL [Elusimicrobiota bacterium]